MTLINSIEAPWKIDPSLGTLPESFKIIQERCLIPLGFIVSNVSREKESSEYGAIQFELEGHSCLFRQAKHTPKKMGQFVTLWKRPTLGSDIAPFDIKDGIDLVFVFVDEASRYGIFVFEATLLLKKGIFSQQSEVGKRAFRVYAPWTIPITAQAKRSKSWQCAQFIELTDADSGLSQLSKKVDSVAAVSKKQLGFKQ